MGVTQNYTQAMSLIQDAAIHGEPNAQATLDNMFFIGTGTSINYQQAMFWYWKAAAQGNPVAQSTISYMYLKGIYVAQDTSQARAWFQKAAQQGQKEAIDSLAQLNAQPSPAVAASQQNNAQQGTCAAVYIINVGGEYGQHYDFGAAWSRSSYDDALAGAKSQLMQVAVGVEPRDLPGGQFGPPPATGSGCTYAHGAVAGKLKIRPSGGSMWNPGGAAGTSILGAGIYDMVTVNFADSTDAAVSVAISQCQTQKGSGDNDNEVCKVLEQW